MADDADDTMAHFRNPALNASIDEPDDDDGEGGNAQSLSAEGANALVSQLPTVPFRKQFANAFDTLSLGALSGFKSVANSLSKDDEGGENDARKYVNRVLNSMFCNSLLGAKFRKELREMGGSIWAELFADSEYKQSKTDKQRKALFEHISKMVAEDLYKHGATKAAIKEFGGEPNSDAFKIGDIDTFAHGKIKNTLAGVKAGSGAGEFEMRLRREEALNDPKSTMKKAFVKYQFSEQERKDFKLLTPAEAALSKAELQRLLIQEQQGMNVANVGFRGGGTPMASA